MGARALLLLRSSVSLDFLKVSLRLARENRGDFLGEPWDEIWFLQRESCRVFLAIRNEGNESCLGGPDWRWLLFHRVVSL